jgi:hypothetical protein
MPSGYFHGAMQGFDGTVTAGALRAKAASGDVFTCAFDAKTYMELEKRRVTVDQLRVGDPLEVLAYRRAGETSCYVLSLQVVPPPILVRPTKRLDVTPTKSIRPAPVRHGNQNFAGVVTRMNTSSITVRSRSEEKTFLLRGDTRFFGNGLKMDVHDVTVNQRLSVEAGRNLEGQLEAFQLTWGEITVP